MVNVPGIETIRGLVGEPPPENCVDFKLMSGQQRLISEWNHIFIAILPFCFKCRVALVWHTPPDDDELFTCPSCGRVWVKGEGWNDKTKKGAKATS